MARTCFFIGDSQRYFFTAELIESMIECFLCAVQRGAAAGFRTRLSCIPADSHPCPGIWRCNITILHNYCVGCRASSVSVSAVYISLDDLSRVNPKITDSSGSSSIFDPITFLVHIQDISVDLTFIKVCS